MLDCIKTKLPAVKEEVKQPEVTMTKKAPRRQSMLPSATAQRRTSLLPVPKSRRRTMLPEPTVIPRRSTRLDVKKRKLDENTAPGDTLEITAPKSRKSGPSEETTPTQKTVRQKICHDHQELRDFVNSKVLGSPQILTPIKQRQ
jgi:hypothetical protein